MPDISVRSHALVDGGCVVWFSAITMYKSIILILYFVFNAWLRRWRAGGRGAELVNSNMEIYLMMLGVAG